MTTVTAAPEDSAFTAWGKRLIAKGQEMAAAKAAEKAAAVAAGLAPVEEPSTVVKLSDEAKALKDAQEWFNRGMKAINEKLRIEEAKWSHAVKPDSTDTSSTLRTKFGSAISAEKEAYVQLELAKIEHGFANGALYEQYQRLIKQTSSTQYTDAYLRTAILGAENTLRIQVNAWSAAPDGTSTPAIPWPASTTPATPRPTPKTQDELIQLSLDQQRQKMGVTTGGADDPVVQRYARVAPPGEPSFADQIAVAQQRIDAVKSEYGALAEVWNKAAERGEAWAQPKPPAPPSTGYNTFRYEENTVIRRTNVAYLPLEMARKSLEFGEFLATSKLLETSTFTSRYGDQAITDVQTYIAALKDHISKLEAGGTYLVYLGINHSVPANQLESQTKTPPAETPSKSQSL